MSSFSVPLSFPTLSKYCDQTGGNLVSISEGVSFSLKKGHTHLVSRLLPCAILSSGEVDLMHDPVIQTIAQKHQKSAAQAGGVPAGRGGRSASSLAELVTY